MPIRRPVLVLAASLALSVALAAPAPAVWFPADSIDGPSADIVGAPDIDLARDGGGGVVYLKREGGTEHLFVSRMAGGVLGPPERVDAGLPGAASAPTVAASDGGRLVIAFLSGDRLYAAFAPGGGTPAPVGPPQLLFDGPAAAPHADIGINGTAYVAFTAGGDVRATRLEAAAWEPVGPPLDVDPAQGAGAAGGPPRVAVSAEGNAVVTWAEGAADGRRRIFARRVTGLVPSAFPQEVSLPDLAGAVGGDADAPDIDIEDDGSFAWVAFRQTFGGVSRTVARRLVGSQFEAPVALDGGQESSTPRFDMNGRGVGYAVATGPGNGVLGAELDKTDAFVNFARLDVAGSAAGPSPVVATSERRQEGVAWRAEGGGTATVQARYRLDEEPFQPEATLSRPEWGPVSPGLELTTSKSGDMAAAFVQGTAAERRLAVAVFDKPPAKPIGQTTNNWRRLRRPAFKWRPGTELWGTQVFKVFVDGAEVGSTEGDELVPAAPLPDGAQRWTVAAVDRRGQTTVSVERMVRVDSTPPRVRVTVKGPRRRGAQLRIRVDASDRGGSKVRSVSVDYGDRTPKATRRRTVHRYFRGGTVRLKIRVSDRAGNVAKVTKKLKLG